MKALPYISVYLNKEYPYFYGNRKSNLVISVFGFAYVLQCMFVMKPNIVFSNIKTDHSIASFVYACITFTVIILYCELPHRLFTKWFEYWTVSKEMLFTISCITLMGLLNYAYILFFGQLTSGLGYFSFIVMGQVLGITLFNGMFPLFTVSMFNFFQLERKRKRFIPVPLQVKENHNQGFTMLAVSENNENFNLDLATVSVIESMGNYVKIYSANNTSQKVSIKRITMKRMEELLEGQQVLIRVHRSYFINLRHVKGINKSSSGDLCLFFHDQNMVATVSRNKKKEISQLLKMQTIL